MKNKATRLERKLIQTLYKATAFIGIITGINIITLFIIILSIIFDV